VKFQSGSDKRVVPLLDPGPGATAGGLSPEHGIHDGGEVESTEARSAETTRSSRAAAAERGTTPAIDGPVVWGV